MGEALRVEYKKTHVWKENKPTKTVNISTVGNALQFPVRAAVDRVFATATWRVSASKCSPHLPMGAAPTPCASPRQGLHGQVKQ